MLLARGESPDESGSVLSLVHKTVISVRSALTGLDRSSLTSFMDGEERIDETGPASQTLRSNRQALLAAIADMRAKAA